MIPNIPSYITLILLVANLAVAFVVWRILSTAADRSGLAPAARRGVRGGSAIFLGGWLGAAMLLAPPPASLLTRDAFYITPLVPLFVLLPPAIALLALWRSPAIRRVLATASVPAIIAVQFCRVVGVVFLILLSLGQLPAHFALPAGRGDIAVGLSAPLVGLAVARGTSGGRMLAIFWNIFGLLDLIVAVGMGTGVLAPLLAPELGARVPSAAAMGVFPMLLVPTFAVPLSVLLHLIALGRLRRDAGLCTGVAALK
jgi:hypothetical protein